MRPKIAQSFHPHERTQTTTTGYIYILPNPSFPQYGKLGYATDVKQRLVELNRSTAVPFAFRVYATYEVDSALSDKEAPLHSGQAEPRFAFCRRSGRQAPHPGILCHAAGGRLRDPRGNRGDQRLPPPSEKTEGDDNSAAGRGAGPADRGAAPGTGLPVRIFQMRHFRGSGAGILLPRE